MVNHPMAEVDPLAAGQLSAEILFNFDRIPLIRQAQSPRNPPHVRVDHHPGGNGEGGAQDNIRRLAANPR